MMKKSCSSLIYILFLGLVIWSCDPIDVPEPDTSNPIFRLVATLNGDSLNWSADNDFFMNTSFEVDTSAVHSFIGKFEPNECIGAACVPALRIAIRDFQVVAPNQVQIEPATATGSYGIYSDRVDTLGLVANWTLSPLWQGGNALGVDVYTWTLGNGSVFTTILNDDLTFQATDLNDISVNLSVDDQLCSASVSKTISTNTITDFSALIEPTIIQGGSMLQLEVQPTGGSAPYTFIWNSGETTQTIFKTLADSIPEIHNHCVNIVSSAGDSLQKCIQVNTEFPTPVGGAEITSICQFDFEADSELEVQTSFDPFQFSTVQIEYTDDMGNVFSSISATQSPNSFFEILSAEPFDDNEDGFPTMKIEFSCSILLENSFGQIIPFETSGSTMAVAFPN